MVRREWLTEFLTRKTLPKDASTVIAQGLTTDRRDGASAAERGNDLAHTLLGIERGDYWDTDKLDAYLERSPTKPQHVSLAVVRGGIESSTSKNTWRYPDPTKAAYLAQLAAWGTCSPTWSGSSSKRPRTVINQNQTTARRRMRKSSNTRSTICTRSWPSDSCVTAT